jgi:hypothetical protein
MSNTRLVIAIAVLGLLTGCNDDREGQRVAEVFQGLNADLTIGEALADRYDSGIGILVEASVAGIAAVRERVARLRQDLADRRVNSSICVGGAIGGGRQRPTVGKTAFTCNDYDYDLLILARPAGQSISFNLRYIEEFADNPLHSGLIEAIRTISVQSIDTAEDDCVRLIFTNPAGGVRNDVPIIVMVRSDDPTSQMPMNEHDLAACLE